MAVSGSQLIESGSGCMATISRQCEGAACTVGSGLRVEHTLECHRQDGARRMVGSTWVLELHISFVISCREMLKFVCVPDSVNEIGDGWFMGCVNLARVSFGLRSCARRFGSEVFRMSGIEFICFHDSVQEIGEMCFCETRKLSSVVFGQASELTHIKTKAFYKTCLAYVELPGALQEIGDTCFGCASLQNLTLRCGPAGVCLRSSAFVCTRLQSMRVPRNCREVCDCCFSQCFI